MNAKPSSTFSLTELLTMIAVVGTLISISIPVVSTGRESADRAVCMSNLREIAMAVMHYARDNEGYLPAANWQGPTISRPGWLYTGPLTGEEAHVDPVAHLMEGQLWPYLERPEVYRCPTDWREFDTPLFQARDQQLSSYVMNGSVQGYFQGPVFRVDDFRPDAIILWEGDERLPFYFNDGSVFPDEGVSLRHGYGGHAAGINGHVEWLSEAEWNVERSRRPGRLWNNPLTPSGGGS